MLKTGTHGAPSESREVQDVWIFVSKHWLGAGKAGVLPSVHSTLELLLADGSHYMHVESEFAPFSIQPGLNATKYFRRV